MGTRYTVNDRYNRTRKEAAKLKTLVALMAASSRTNRLQVQTPRGCAYVRLPTCFRLAIPFSYPPSHSDAPATYVAE